MAQSENAVQPDFSEEIQFLGHARSTDISEIAKALCQFQAGNPVAKKSKQNPHFGNDYADLTDVMEVALDITDHGLAITQLLGNNKGGDVTCTTLLMHTSGQWMEMTVCLPPTQRTPQGYGSAIAYMRRYSVSSILGISAGSPDDDGEGASAGNATVNVDYVDWPAMIESASSDPELRRIYRQARRALAEASPEKWGVVEPLILARRNQPEVKDATENGGVAKGKGRKADGNKD